MPNGVLIVPPGRVPGTMSSSTQRRQVRLKLISPPSIGAVVTAPPPVIAGAHIIDYQCARCDEILMHADDGQVHNLVIQCVKCGSYNSTDV